MLIGAGELGDTRKSDGFELAAAVVSKDNRCYGEGPSSGSGQVCLRDYGIMIKGEAKSCLLQGAGAGHPDRALGSSPHCGCMGLNWCIQEQSPASRLYRAVIEVGPLQESQMRSYYNQGIINYCTATA